VTEKTVCFFGKLNKYPRQLFFKNAFEQCGYKIIYIDNNKNIFFRHFLNLRILFLRFDLIFVSWPGWSDLIFAKLLSLIKQKKLIYDCFTTSQEDYLDNFHGNTNYFKKIFYYFADIISLKLPDHIITDTKYHKFYIIKKYNIKNISCIYINEKKTFYNKKSFNKKNLDIIFVGAFRNLHGIENIIKAHRIVNLYNKNINLRLIGTDYGKKFENLAKMMRLQNIFFYRRVNYKSMINYIEESDVCLGIFGESIKAQNVISNFLVTACRLGKIIVTLRTGAAEEIFKNNPSCFLISKPIVQNLAKKILKINKNIKLIKKGSNTKIIYNNIFNSSVQKESFKKLISKYCI
jgi:glycosyltransferase involved in cell wall biosynthesis